MCSSVLANPSLIYETNDKDNPSVEYDNLWTQYHYDPYYGFVVRTNEANIDGTVQDTLYVSENIDLLRDGSVGKIDNSFAFDCASDDNTPASNSNDFCSGDGPLALSINFRQSSRDTNVNTAGGHVSINSNYQGYDYNPGNLDRGGGMKAETIGDDVLGSSQFTYDFGGFTSGSIIEGIDSILPLEQKFEMPAKDECLGGMDRCWGEGWEHFFPLCGNMAECNASSHFSSMQIGNGFQSRNAFDWAINTNYTRSNLIYSIPLDNLLMFDSDGERIASFLWRSDIQQNWTSIDTITHHNAGIIEYRLTYDPTYYREKCLSNQESFFGLDSKLYCMIPHDVIGRTPDIELFNTTTEQSFTPRPNSTIKYDSISNTVYFQIGYKVDDLPITNVSNSSLATPTAYFEEDIVVYDPATGYLNNQQTFRADEDGAIYDNRPFTANDFISTVNIDWNFATDRDGGAIYGYGDSAGCDTQSYITLSIRYTECYWYTSMFYDEIGFDDQTGDWGKHKVGDGWCRSSGYDRNAGCRVQGIGTSTLSNNHWNVEADAGLAALPLIDSTRDFDGMIVQMELSRYHWTGQVNRGGWEDIHIELGLQAMAYSPFNMIIDDNALEGGSVGELLGAQGGWYETCANGYLDLFVIPEADFHAWRGHGKYGFIYDYDGVINTQNSLSDTTITDPNHPRYGDEFRTVFGGGMPDGRFNYPHINWNIAPDDDEYSSSEWWYDEVGNSNNLFELDSREDGSLDGHKRGPSSESTGAGNTWVDTEEENNGNPQDWIQDYMVDGLGNQIAERDGAGSMWTMNEDSQNYWGEIYDHSLGYTFGDAHFKENPFHAYNTEGYWQLQDSVFEQRGIDPVYTGYRAIGSEGITSGGTIVDGVYDSSFNHMNDFHDINIYTNPYWDSLPLGPIGKFDAAGGQIQSDNSFAPSSALEEYHLKTIELGSASSDFCYDPNSAGGSGVARQDSSGYHIEPDASTLLAHNAQNGQTYLNIPLTRPDGTYPFDAGGGLLDAAIYQPSSTTESLVSDGFLRDAYDPTIGFILMVDYRGRSGPQNNVCWGDWATATDEFDGNEGNWYLYNTENSFSPAGIELAQSQRDQFCLDKNGPSGQTGNDVDFSEFIADNSCVSDEPTTGSGPAANDDKAFWCGLNLISPMSSQDTVVLKANTKPFIPLIDTDGDGVLDPDDKCPGTPLFSWVDLDGDSNGDAYINTPVDVEGCPTNQPVPPYGGNNDYDGDGVIDLFDKCDGQNTSPTQQVGYATDYPATNPYWYDGGGIVHATTYMNSDPKPPVNRDGCPVKTNSNGAAVDDNNDIIDDAGNGQGQHNGTFTEKCTNVQQDLGIYYWEDNDADGLIDEDDPFDGIDNDGDGLEGEDWFDDCPNDGIDNRGSSTFTGELLGSISHETVGGLQKPNGGYVVIAENSSNPVREAGIHAIENYNGEGFTSALMGQGLLGGYGDTLIYEDSYRNPTISCNWRGAGNTLPNMKMEMYVWVDEGTLQQALSREAQTNPSATSLDDLIYYTSFGTNPSGVYQNPAGTGEAGRYVPYGSIIQSQVLGAGYNLRVGYSAWSATNIGQADIASEVGPRTAT